MNALMDKEAPLLRAICEQPDEDIPRLVFADWLQERGDRVSMAWADAIRTQVARAAGAADIPESQFFQTQENSDYISIRLGVPAQLDARRWERGFPTCLDGNFVRLSAAWPRLLNRIPFYRLRVVMDVAPEAAIAAFTTWPGIKLLTDLTIQSWSGDNRQDNFHEGALRTLAACPALSSLVSLKLDGVMLTDAGVEAVLTSSSLRRLKSLQFRCYGPTHLTNRVSAQLTARFDPDGIVGTGEWHMDEEAALLRAICEQPDEDTPRLVFADWLQEQGRPVNMAWANGIRSQVAHKDSATAGPLPERSKVFDSVYGRDKVLTRIGWPPELDDPTWERGFPSVVRSSFSKLRGFWPALAHRVPVRSLHVSDLAAPDTAEFVTWPGLLALRELQLVGRWRGSPPSGQLLLLAKCPGLQGLEALRLDSFRVDNAELTAALNSPNFIRLKSLRIPALAPWSARSPWSALSPSLQLQLRLRFGPNVFDNPV